MLKGVQSTPFYDRIFPYIIEIFKDTEVQNMSPMLVFDSPEVNPAIIKVVGIGGAGCNAVNRMIEAEIKG